MNDMLVTFGQTHVHSINGKTFDKDCVAKIKCEDYDDGRAKAWYHFGSKFCFTYYGDELAKCDDEFMQFFPRGIISVENEKDLTT